MSNTFEQLTLGAQFDHHVTRMEQRFESVREFRGLVLWTGVLRLWEKRFKKREKQIAGELMLLESEVRAGDRESALSRLGKLKGLLGMLCLFLTSATLLPEAGEQFIRRAGGRSMRVRRVEGAEAI